MRNAALLAVQQFLPRCGYAGAGQPAIRYRTCFGQSSSWLSRSVSRVARATPLCRSPWPMTRRSAHWCRVEWRAVLLPCSRSTVSARRRAASKCDGIIYLTLTLTLTHPLDFQKESSFSRGFDCFQHVPIRQWIAYPRAPSQTGNEHAQRKRKKQCKHTSHSSSPTACVSSVFMFSLLLLSQNVRSPRKKSNTQHAP